MAKKRLQKKRSSSTVRKQESEILQVTTSKTEPVRVETSKVEPVKVETSKVEPVKLDVPVDLTLYNERFQKHYDELKWLYCELYQDRDDVMTYLHDLTSNMEAFYNSRNSALKASDKKREADPDWYKRNDLVGMMMYVNNFAHTLKGLEEHLDYVEECNVNYLHLMPLLASPKGKSDGGYAVADFRTVQPELGTMEDFSELTSKCHERGINICLDFVMNHTSEDHEWAQKARMGEGEYMSRYFFCDNENYVREYEKTVPQVFPETAPGNFTWLPEIGHYVLTTFYPYQWDLNYKNPRVFNEMMYNFLFLVNQGIDILRIDAVPYIWKEMGTSCRNLPQVHTIVRMMRMIGEIGCPSVVLLGEGVMEPEKVVPYFGTIEKPECHMLYNVTMMATTWNTVATRDTRLLRMQLDIMNNLPKEYTFLNYLRCHDDIGWGLDFQTLSGWGMQEVPHKRYLNDFFTGKIAESVSRGELYNEDPITGDARFCATTASMCGIESAGFEQNEEKKKRAVRFDLMLHAYMMVQSGIPMLYSGDEIGQVNDYSYKDDPDKAVDSRYLHRGEFNWSLAPNRNIADTVQGKLFHALDPLEHIRSSHSVFDTTADLRTIDTWDSSILAIVRENAEEKFIGIYNFSDQDKVAWINEDDGIYTDLISGHEMEAKGVMIPAFGCFWLCRKK